MLDSGAFTSRLRSWLSTPPDACPISTSQVRTTSTALAPPTTFRAPSVVQDIRYFRRHTDVALNVGLLVDTNGSQILLLEEERNAGSLFFRAVLRQDLDNAFVMTFDREVELPQDFTSSFDELEGGLASMAPPGAQPFRGSGRRVRPTSTALHDAVYLAGDELFRHRDGRKVAVIVSDGHDFGSKKTLDEAI